MEAQVRLGMVGTPDSREGRDMGSVGRVLNAELSREGPSGSTLADQGSREAGQGVERNR